MLLEEKVGLFLLGGGGVLILIKFCFIKEKYNKNIREEGINKIKDDS